MKIWSIKGMVWMTERFTLGKEYDVDGNYEYCYVDEETGKTFNFADEYCEKDFLKLVNTVIDNLKKENEELKQSVNNLRNTLVTIGGAYQIKYGRTLVDLVGEIHEEDI